MRINENNEMMERYCKSLLNEAYSESEDYIGFEDDALDGKPFGYENKFFHVVFKGIANIIDDSDFSPQGYGRHVHPEYQKTIEFNITEMDPAGNTLRTTEQIQQDDPELFKKLLNHAITQSVEKYNSHKI